MTAAQKKAKANFKKAIAYRQKTGVSLKEAFAHVYGKKNVAPKKKATKKAVPKKAAKKVVKKAAPKKTVLSFAKKAAAKVKSLARKAQDAYYEGYYEGKPAALAKKKAELKAKRTKPAKKKISEQSILNKIHKVKDQVNQLDELQHKHMIGSIDKYKNTMKEVKLYDAALRKVSDNFKGLSAGERARVKRVKKKLIDARNELKTHAAQLKKTF